jgi:hypothetical protein
MDIILQSRYAGRHVPMGPAFRQYRRAAAGARHHRRPDPRDAADRALPHRGTLFPLLRGGGAARHDRDRHRHVLRADRTRLDRPSQHPRRRRLAGDGDTCRPAGRIASGCARMGRMRLRIFTEPQQGASYATLRRVATTAEALGFDVETSRIRLGTLVTAATFRLPGPLAIAVAQVDDMSGGRVELGIGTAGRRSTAAPKDLRRVDADNAGRLVPQGADEAPANTHCWRTRWSVTDVKSTIRSAWYPQVSSADRRYSYPYPAARPMRSSDQYIRQGCYG